MIHSRRRFATVAILLFLAVFWLQPTGAFDRVTGMSRTVSASVVTDANAYNAVTGGTCTGITISGGPCTFTITNKGTTGQTYTVTKTSDVGGIVTSHSLSNTGEIAVGSSTTLTANAKACVSCAGQTYNVYWTIAGAKAGILNAEETRYHMTIRYL